MLLHKLFSQEPGKVGASFLTLLRFVFGRLGLRRGGGGGGNAIYVPYGDVPPIRVYFLAFDSETGCLFSSLTQGTKFV